MSLNIQLKVKFRAFGITLGSLAKQAFVAIGINGVSYSLGPVTEPPVGAHNVVDERGVKLTVWQWTP